MNRDGLRHVQIIDIFDLIMAEARHDDTWPPLKECGSAKSNAHVVVVVVIVDQLIVHIIVFRYR